ncbi:hypothetical protein HYW21_01970 [Candidatus Woesearchaeota archaeon]|nr:hypothetical protein [Candidatus Woesearchaeota archaeon]
MLIWRDIGFKKHETWRDRERVSGLAYGYAERIGQLPNPGDSYDAPSIASSILRAYEQFLEETKTVLRWDDVPKDKQRFDHEQLIRAMFVGYKGHFDSSPEEIEQELERFSGTTLDKDKGLSWYHSMEGVVAFCEGVRFTREEAVVFLNTLLGKKALYDPLYVHEALNHPERFRFGEQSRNPEELARAIAGNYERSFSYERNDSGRNEVLRINDERTLAEEFFARREKEGAFPGKFVVHSIDSQASAKAWRTYEQFATITAAKLGSIATYGLVPGGVVSGINPAELYGTLDRADLMIMNWYPRFQGGVVIPVELFAQNGFGCEFTNSMSVMIDGEKGTGTDVIARPNEEGILPYLSPSAFVAVIPRELQSTTIDEIARLHGLLQRSSHEIPKTLEQCIGYDPSLWKNFHYFNEWLQTTPQGNALLEARIGRPVSGLKSTEKIKANIRDGRYFQNS